MSEPNADVPGGDDEESPLLAYDESVFLLAKQGHLPAQNQLVESHQRMLRGFVATLCADLTVSDDLAQEVFLRGLRRLDRVEDATAFPAFLRGIARNVVREHFKKTQRRHKNNERYLNWAEESWEAYQVAGGTGQESAAGLHDRLRVCLKRLTERARKLFRMRYEEDLNSGEIGKEVGMTPEAVRTAVSRTRRTLLDCLKGGAS